MLIATVFHHSLAVVFIVTKHRWIAKPVHVFSHFFVIVLIVEIIFFHDISVVILSPINFDLDILVSTCYFTCSLNDGVP